MLVALKNKIRKRKDLLFIVLMILLFSLINNIYSAEKLDEFGGFKEIGLPKNKQGWGVLQHLNRWWFSTPKGHAYIPIGVNHTTVLMRKSWEKDYQKTHYYQQYKSNWSSVYRVVADTLKEYGYNNGGYDGNSYLGEHLPYFTATSFINAKFYSKDFAYADVFSSKVKNSLERKIIHLTKPHIGKMNHMGYFWTDCIVWEIEQARKIHGEDWVSWIRNLEETNPGKQKYIEFLRSRYTEQKLRKLYNATFIPLDLKHAAIVEDDRDFLGIIAKEYFKTLHDLYKKYDPDKLLFGDRFRLRDHPKEVLLALKPFIDVLAIQVGDHHHDRGLELYQPDETWFDGETFDELYETLQKPIVICDHQCGFFDSVTPQTGTWFQYASALESARSYDTFMKEAFRKPYIVGYLRCQYISVWRDEVNKYKQGILKPNGSPFTNYLKGIQKTHQQLKEELLSR